MPYIPLGDRVNNIIDTLPIANPDKFISRLTIGTLLGHAARNAGDFNYMISIGISEFIKNNGLNYAHCNEIIGMLECCKREFQRKVVDPYEEKKIKENGDGVYSFDNLHSETY